MINNNSGQINTLIKLDLGELNQENPSESNENKENSDNCNNSNSNKDYSSINNPELQLDEDAQNVLKENMKNPQKINNKKSKSRRSRLTIDPQEETTPQHPKKIYTEEEKLKKAKESSIYFNWYLMNKRNEFNTHFLKRKIEQSYERDDKLQVFFNVPFFPKEEMFMHWQLAHNNNYLHNLNRNAQYNKMGGMPNRNMNYPNNMRYPNNNINNNINKNNNSGMGNMNNNMKAYPQNNYSTINNNNNPQANIKNPNNLSQLSKTQNNILNPSNKINQASTINNINNPNLLNNMQNPKPAKPILDTSLLKDSNNKYNLVNKIDSNNLRKNPLFALTTDSPSKNDEMNKSRKKENENNDEIKEDKKEEVSEIKEIGIDNNEDNKK